MEKMYVLFSCRREDERYMNLYIDEIMNANEAYQKYLISKLVLRNCGNIAISPHISILGLRIKKQKY